MLVQPRQLRCAIPRAIDSPCIDHTNPLTERLMSALILDGDRGLIDLNTPSRQTFRGRAGAVAPGAPCDPRGAKSYRYGNGGQSYHLTDVRGGFGNSNDVGSVAALVCHYDPYAASHHWGLWSQGEVTDNNFSWTVGGRGDTLAFSSNAFASQSIYTAAGGWIAPGRWTLLGWSRKASNGGVDWYSSLGLWEVNTGSTGNSGSVGAQAVIGSSFQNQSVRADSDLIGLIGAIFVWKGRLLTKAEYDMLADNPFLFVKRRRTPVWRTSGAAPPATDRVPGRRSPVYDPSRHLYTFQQ